MTQSMPRGIRNNNPGNIARNAVTEAIIAHENADYRYPADVVARGIGMALNKTVDA